MLTWNLYHGRAEPPAGRALLGEFAAALAGWSWDVALLQEVPPWWPPELAAACGARERTALTSRNALLPLRRALAERAPDLIKSNGGGANAILVRGSEIVDERRLLLRRLPERRVAHGVRTADGLWAVNLHATVHDDDKAREDLARAARAARAWAGEQPFVLGGDFNVRDPKLAGLDLAAGNDVDFVFVRGGAPAGAGEVLERGSLSDHAPVAVDLSDWDPAL